MTDVRNVAEAPGFEQSVSLNPETAGEDEFRKLLAFATAPLLTCVIAATGEKRAKVFVCVGVGQLR